MQLQRKRLEGSWVFTFRPARGTQSKGQIRREVVKMQSWQMQGSRWLNATLRSHLIDLLKSQAQMCISASGRGKLFFFACLRTK